MQVVVVVERLAHQISAMLMDSHELVMSSVCRCARSVCGLNCPADCIFSDPETDEA